MRLLPSMGDFSLGFGSCSWVPVWLSLSCLSLKKKIQYQVVRGWLCGWVSTLNVRIFYHCFLTDHEKRSIYNSFINVPWNLSLSSLHDLKQLLYGFSWSLILELPPVLHLSCDLSRIFIFIRSPDSLVPIVEGLESIHPSRRSGGIVLTCLPVQEFSTAFSA